MKLGRHLLETCKLRKKTATGGARLEAEWWERWILRGNKERKVVEKSAHSRVGRSEPAPAAEVRRCVVCEAEAPTNDGLLCENAHFVCAKPECRQVGFFSQIQRVICPVCARLLR